MHCLTAVCLFQIMTLIIIRSRLWVGGTTDSTSDQQSTNDRKVAGSRPTKIVCITVLTGNRLGWTARCGRPPLLLPSYKKLEFRLSALMDSDLAWIWPNVKSGRQSWRFPALYTVSQKRRHYTLVHIFAKYWPIFTILSPTYSVGTV